MLSGERSNKNILHSKIAYILLLGILIPNNFLIAQSDTTATIVLEEVAVNESYLEKYGTGNSMITFDSLELSLYQTTDLALLLSEKTPIYIKNYGNGMLSTISFRGTGAQHTATLWNGININIPSLGQSDFSLLPLFGSDKIEVHFGGSSALVGTDAIGGSINIKTTIKPEHSSFSFMESVGSFGKFSSNLKAHYSSSKWYVKTQLFHRQADNDFRFKNITKTGFPIEKQENAAYSLIGFTQGIGYEFNQFTSISFHGWYNKSHRQIQPTMSVKDNSIQDDENIRIMGDFVSNYSNGKISIKFAYLNDKIFFSSDAITSTSKIAQWVFMPEYEFEIGKNISSRIGGKWNIYLTDIDSYGKKITENRKSIYASFLYSHKSLPLKANLNLRQVLVMGFEVPFTPSLGLTYSLLHKNCHEILIRGNISKNYRLPTLNERYWDPGGNPNIKPEESVNKEIGVDYSLKKEKLKIQTKLTYFHNNTRNRVFWFQKKSVWIPKNLAIVTSQGLEVFLQLKISLNKVAYKIGSSYGYTKAITKKTDHSAWNNLIGKQLIYVPIHKINFHVGVFKSRWIFRLNGNFTSARRTTADKLLKEFFLADLYGTYKLNISRKLFTTAIFTVRNLFNLDYQNYENRAMPKRNFELGLQFNL